MWVLDTNTLIDFFKGQGGVAKHLLEHSPRDIAIPGIVLYELEMGIAKSTSPKKRKQQLNNLLAVIRLLPFDRKEAAASAIIRSTLKKNGTPIGPYDVLIAGTALAHRATLVTRNQREFSRVDGLVLEDWF